MAKLKRYDLYEGDDEYISSVYSGKQPLGRDKGLQERDAYDARMAEEKQKKRRYFAANEADDGLGAPSSLFDDFDRFEKPITMREERPVYRRPQPHRGAWTAVTIVCSLLLIAMGLAVVPQLTGLRYRFLPNLAFVNRNWISMNIAQSEEFTEWQAEVFTDRIYQGVYIDNIHVGGMTREEAVREITEAHGDTAQAFDIVVTVGNESWHVNSERVPVSRNTEETVERAWAYGRGNTKGLSGIPDSSGEAKTPFMERVIRVSAMRPSPVIYATVQDYDHDALMDMVVGICNYVNRDPVNSQVETFNFNTKTFTFTEDRPGAYINPDDLYTQLTGLLDSGVTKREIRVVPEKILAEVTRTELMNRFGLIAAYSTQTTNNANRNTNIELAARAINGTTVRPGEIFSFNGTTGERTAAKGYREAPAIAGGQSRDEVGGGVCQVSSTLFNAVARADLEIIERNPHAWPSSYIEKGFDATVNWPGLDFRFRNNTDQPIFIVAGYSKRTITVNIYGMSLGSDVRIDLESELVRTIPQPEGTEYVVNTDLAPGESKKTVTGRKGYVVNTWKVWYQGNRETRRELFFTTTYKAYKETIEYNPR